MTQEEREELAEAKRGVTERLSALKFTRYQLWRVDSRLHTYVKEVIKNPHEHCLWEQLSVERFFKMIDKYKLDKQEVKRFIAFYEFLHFQGKKGLQRYKLTPVQLFQFANVYGFWRKPDKEERLVSNKRRRVVRECVLFVPRKFSKTTGSAAFALYDLFFGDSNGECYIGANSQDQAKKCFEVIRSAVLKLDPYGRDFVVNKAEIRPTRRNKRQAFAQCLTANARTKDGLNASTVIMDEFSQARDSNLLNVLTTSMGVRENPLTVIITTASDVFDGPFYSMLKGYKDVLLGKYDDDRLFAHLFEPDIDDVEEDPSTWKKVHPHLGITVQPSYYKDELSTAKRNGAEAMLAFRTKLLNMYTENEQKAWISGTMARDHSKDISLQEMFAGATAVTVGVDLSIRDDFSAVTFASYHAAQQMFYYHTAYFIPSGGMEGHANEILYRKWAEDKHLIIQEGEVINYAEIVQYIIERVSGTPVVAVCYDPAKSKDFINMMATTDVGYALRPFKQTNYHFTSAVQSFEILMRTNHVVLADNPITHYCFGNASLVTDNMGNMKPYKRTANGKIDGVVTTLMAHAAFEETPRYY